MCSPVEGSEAIRIGSEMIVAREARSSAGSKKASV
jgi:hypothetical protein